MLQWVVLVSVMTLSFPSTHMPTQKEWDNSAVVFTACNLLKDKICLQRLRTHKNETITRQKHTHSRHRTRNRNELIHFLPGTIAVLNEYQTSESQTWQLSVEGVKCFNELLRLSKLCIEPGRKTGDNRTKLNMKKKKETCMNTNRRCRISRHLSNKCRCLIKIRSADELCVAIFFFSLTALNT